MSECMKLSILFNLLVLFFFPPLFRFFHRRFVFVLRAEHGSPRHGRPGSSAQQSRHRGGGEIRRPRRVSFHCIFMCTFYMSYVVVFMVV